MIKILSMTLVLGMMMFILTGTASASIAPAEVVSACQRQAIEDGATDADMADYVNPCLEEQGFSPLAKAPKMNQDVQEAQEVVEESGDNQ